MDGLDFGTITDIQSIWNNFFMPMVVAAAVLIMIFVLLGKDCIDGLYQRFKLIKADGKYYRQKHIRYTIEGPTEKEPTEEEPTEEETQKKKLKKKKAKKKKLEKTILIPIKEYEEVIIREILKKPIIVFVFMMFIIYALYKASFALANVMPITYAYSDKNLLLSSVHEYTLANIWAHFPEDSLYQIYSRIIELGKDNYFMKNRNNNMMSIYLETISKVGMLLSVVFLLPFPLKREKKYLRSLLVFLCSFLILVGTYAAHFESDKLAVEQAAYAVEENLNLEHTDEITYEDVKNKLYEVQKEKAYDSKFFSYNKPDIKVGIGKFDFSIVDLIGVYLLDEF